MKKLAIKIMTPKHGNVILDRTNTSVNKLEEFHLTEESDDWERVSLHKNCRWKNW